MAEPFKNLLNETAVISMAEALKKHDEAFNQDAFVAEVNSKLAQLELKARTDLITANLVTYLPKDFTVAAEVLHLSLAPIVDELSFNSDDSSGIKGWAVVPLTYYVAQCGNDHFEISMTLFKAMTMRLSAEFGIRYFLKRQPAKTMAEMKKWTQDSNLHIRRLASEGCRPRLPWGIRLSDFVSDPSLVIELLEMLKDDPEEYVRRSVANNLNDIAKDHPNLVSGLMQQWLVNATEERKRLISHACRTLIKQGHENTLRILGYHPAALKNIELSLTTSTVLFGDKLTFNLALDSKSDVEQLVMIDYIIHHKKANGSTSPKVFKWRKIKLVAGQHLEIAKAHAIKPITTRVYYAGTHQLEVVVNGKSIAKQPFELIFS